MREPIYRKCSGCSGRSSFYEKYQYLSSMFSMLQTVGRNRGCMAIQINYYFYKRRISETTFIYSCFDIITFSSLSAPTSFTRHTIARLCIHVGVGYNCQPGVLYKANMWLERFTLLQQNGLKKFSDAIIECIHFLIISLKLLYTKYKIKSQMTGESSPSMTD